MSQSGRFTPGITPGTFVETLTGNTGGPVPANGAGNINIVGDGTTIEVVGNPGTNTLTIEAGSGIATTYVANSGTASPFLGDIDLLGTSNITTTASGHTVDFALSGTTDHAVQLGNAGGSLSSLGVGTNGQVLLGATGSDPAFATLTSTGSTIVFTTGANTLNLETASKVADSFPTDSGTAVPSTGALTIAGGHNISTSGSGSTVTINVSGTTNHDVQIGNSTGSLTSVTNGTTGQVLTAQTGADPIWASPAASSISITGDSGGAITGATFTFTGGTTGLAFAGAGSTETLGGTLAIANGGTNATSMTTTDGTVYFDGTRLVTTATGTSGQVLTSAGAGVAPAYASPAASSISITGDTGGALTGAAFTFTGGTTGLSFGGSGSTETVSGTLAVKNGGTGATTLTGVLTGNGTSAVTASAVTQHDVLVGGASNAITSVAPSATSGVPLISQGSSSDPAFGTAVVAGGGTGATSFTAYGVLTGGTTTTGAVQSLAALGASGTVLTSNGASALPSFQAVASGGFTFSVITADQTAAINNGYICNKAGLLTLTLPTTSAAGSLIEVTGMNTALGWKIAQNASQIIHFGSVNTTSGTGGSLASTLTYDGVRIVCSVANLEWIVLPGTQGNITVV